MDTLSHLRTLFAYDAWANRQFLAAMKSMKNPPPRSVKVLAHIVATEWLWLNRLNREKARLAVWPDFTVTQTDEQFAPLPEIWSGLLIGAAERLATPLKYVNTRGEEWTSTMHDILTHVVIHSAYHRGQIAMDLRSAGFDPPYTDFIHATRQHFVE